MVTSTSLKAYYGDALPTLGKRHEAVLKAFMEKGPMSNSELANYLQWPINTITPRVGELREKGLVRAVREKKCPVTGRQVTEWEGVVGRVTKTEGIPRVFWEGRKEELSGQMKLI